MQASNNTMEFTDLPSIPVNNGVFTVIIDSMKWGRHVL